MENKIFTPNDAKAACLREWRARNRDHVREYNRNYRKDNPEIIKAANKRFWQRKAEQMTAAAQNTAGDNSNGN